MTCLYILVLLVLLSGVCVCLSVCPLPHVNMARGEPRVSKPKFEGPLIANKQAGRQEHTKDLAAKKKCEVYGFGCC